MDRPPLRPVLRRLAITRLGDGLDADGLIREAAAARTAAVVEEFAAAAEDAGAEPMVFATYAVRAARNPAMLLERLARPVRVLSGEDEARLGFLGAVAGLGRGTGDAHTLVLDIGGGSVELTRGTSRRVEESHSVPLGCVVLTQRFLAHDPPQDGEVAALRAHVARTLAPLLDRFGREPDAAIGVGGTITTLAALVQELVPYDPDRVHGYRLALPQVAGALDVLRARPLEARRTLPGLQPERADVIIAGALVLHDVLEGLGGRSIEVSEADLLWAVLMDA
ncbi:MAG TPA: hypothetical protein VEZ44_06335 [bacterium]|nr:hypothetical protein [bacterium]